MEGGKFVSNLIVGGVPYPGNLWKRYASLGAKKKELKESCSTLPKRSFFIKQIINAFLLCEI